MDDDEDLIEVVTSPDGPLLLLKGSWHARFANDMQERGIDALSIGSATTNLEFLAHAHWIRRLIVVGFFESLTSLQSMEWLRDLTIGGGWQNRIDFSGLCSLEQCEIDCGGPGAESILQCTQLRTLHLRSFRRASGENAFAGLRMLENLRIDDSPFRSLPTLGCPERLSVLWINGCRQFDDLKSICDCHNLRELRIMSCPRIRDVAPLANLKKLTTLDLVDCGAIDSLNPLKNHPCFGSMSLHGTEVRDSH